MSDFNLISHHLCPYVQRAVIVLTEKNISHKRTYIDLAAKPDWFSDMSPLGRVPILQTGGSVLFESQVIAEYLDEVTPGSLHPSDPLAKARHRSWIEFGSDTLKAISGFYGAQTAEAFRDKHAALRSKFERIDREISGPLFEGEKFHMVDGVWGTIFRYLDVFDQIDDFGLLNGLGHAISWREKMATRPSVANAPPKGYEDRLEQFLRNKNSYISTLLQ
ncbi:MAG: glutathione S-transferase family protein [Rhizobiaceae bacterium]